MAMSQGVPTCLPGQLGSSGQAYWVGLRVALWHPTCWPLGHEEGRRLRRLLECNSPVRSLPMDPREGNCLLQK